MPPVFEGNRAWEAAGTGTKYSVGAGGGRGQIESSKRAVIIQKVWQISRTNKAGERNKSARMNISLECE